MILANTNHATIAHRARGMRRYPIRLPFPTEGAGGGRKHDYRVSSPLKKSKYECGTGFPPVKHRSQTRTTHSAITTTRVGLKNSMRFVRYCLQ